MALTLAQAKVGMANKVDEFVIDLFQRKSRLLDLMVFDDAISPQGGSTLSYSYEQELTPSVAAGRAINNDYTPGEAIRTLKTTNLKVIGGSYQLDRVIINTPSKRLDEVSYQTKKKVEAVVNLFHQLFINGNATANVLEFDGLDQLLWQTDTELKEGVLDIASMTADEGQQLINDIDLAIAKMVRKPDVMICNSFMRVKIKEAAHRIGYYSRAENALGTFSDFYDNTIEIVDLGQFYDGTYGLQDIVKTRTAAEYREVEVTADTFVTDGSLYTESSGTYSAVTTGSYNSATTYYKLVGRAGSTDIYFACLGQEEVCGLSPEGNKIVNVYNPNFASADAVLKGAVEAVWGLAVKNSKAAAVIRDIKVK